MLQQTTGEAIRLSRSANLRLGGCIQPFSSHRSQIGPFSKNFYFNNLRREHKKIPMSAATMSR